MISETSVRNYLQAWPGLAHLCVQHGCIDCDSLRFEVLSERGHSAVIKVLFDEIVAAKSGAAADRLARSGELELVLDCRGDVRSAFLC